MTAEQSGAKLGVMPDQDADPPAQAQAPRAGFALLLSLSMAQFMVVLDVQNTAVNFVSLHTR
jgi:hypothetical protein